MGGKGSSSSKDPLGGQRGQAADEFMKLFGEWGGSTPQMPSFMQGASSTMAPMQSTLNEAISTGMPTNTVDYMKGLEPYMSEVAGAGAARGVKNPYLGALSGQDPSQSWLQPTSIGDIANMEEGRARRALEQDIVPQLMEQYGVGGGRFGTDVSNAIAKTTGDVYSDIALKRLEAETGARESAKGRALTGLTTAGGLASQEGAFSQQELDRQLEAARLRLATGDASAARDIAQLEAAAGRRMQGVGMAGLPIELQKQLMMIPELLQFVLGAMPQQKSSQWNIEPPPISVNV